ncbi:hypothetical protein H4S04_007621 [Coemansia sp. S16]|nr:hypothetical protein GGI14_004255 [Coemansia sp. S680]KAJ2041742.1 hypothetical protein H4S04_007621 [Coemansia sp. S16]
MNELHTAKAPGQIDNRLHSTPLSVVPDTVAPRVDVRPEVGLPKKRRRPPYSYTALIAQAIIVSKNKQLTLREIYDSINDAYPQICQGPDIGWQNTIRHNLSLNQCFKRIPRHQLPPSLSSRLRGKGSYWTVDVELMDPGTRMRLEEALALGAATSSSTLGNSTESLVSTKRAKLSPKSSRPKPGRLSNASSDGGNGVMTFMPDPQSYCPSNQSSPYTYYGDEDIQYVSPAAQSSSPYFQSTMNSPIPMPTLPVKHMLPPIPHCRTAADASANHPQHLPPLTSAMPRPLQGNRLYSRVVQHRGTDKLASSPFAANSNHPHWSGVPDSPPPLDNESTSLLTYTAPQYSFGTAVSYSRSTARPASQTRPMHHGSAFASGPTLTPILSSLESRKQSPYSLSPASTVMHLHETSGNNSDAEASSELVKLTINHLLN